MAVVPPLRSVTNGTARGVFNVARRRVNAGILPDYLLSALATRLTTRKEQRDNSRSE